MFIQKKKDFNNIKILLSLLMMSFLFFSKSQSCRKYGFWHKVFYCICHCGCPKEFVVENNLDLSNQNRLTGYVSSINDDVEDQNRLMFERLKIEKKVDRFLSSKEDTENFGFGSLLPDHIDSDDYKRLRSRTNVGG